MPRICHKARYSRTHLGGSFECRKGGGGRRLLQVGRAQGRAGGNKELWGESALIQLVDSALEKFLRAEVPLPEAAIDVSFNAPDRAWGSGITKPTINIYLWDVKRSAPRAQAGVVEMTDEGQVFRRAPHPVVHLTYYVTAWAAELRDEHQLLGSVLRTVLGNAQLPPDHVDEELHELAPILLEIASSEQRKPGDFSSTLDGQLKTGFEVRVTLEVDAHRWKEAGPPTSAIEYGMNRLPDHAPEPPTTLEPSPQPRTRRGGSVVVEGRREALNGDDAPTKA